MKIIKEDFSSIHQLINTLSKRENNYPMREENSSDSGSFSFTETKSYDDAVKLLQFGYTDVLNKVRSSITKLEKKLDTDLYNVEKIKPFVNVEGYIPHVPNSILNLPNSMINSIRHIQKQKTVNIVYAMGGYCGEEANFFIKAGTVLLTAIKILELNRISVRLTCSFMGASDERYIVNANEVTIPTVLIKDYAQRLDLQKICFPLVHPSMFRRIGFKWLETHPDIKSPLWSNGYGYSIEDSNRWGDFLTKINPFPDRQILCAQDIRSYNYDVKKLLNKILKQNIK